MVVTKTARRRYAQRIAAETMRILRVFRIRARGLSGSSSGGAPHLRHGDHAHLEPAQAQARLGKSSAERARRRHGPLPPAAVRACSSAAARPCINELRPRQDVERAARDDDGREGHVDRHDGDGEGDGLPPEPVPEEAPEEVPDETEEDRRHDLAAEVPGRSEPRILSAVSWWRSTRESSAPRQAAVLVPEEVLGGIGEGEGLRHGEVRHREPEDDEDEGLPAAAPGRGRSRRVEWLPGRAATPSRRMRRRVRPRRR
jgi:hypothetical protein